MITDYHSKYLATDLVRRRSSDSNEKLAVAVAGAQVDMNPHQVDAALFAFASPLSKGALLADEVGLGKTIEAGLDGSRFRRGKVPPVGRNEIRPADRRMARPLTRKKALGAKPQRGSSVGPSGPTVRQGIDTRQGGDKASPWLREPGSTASLKGASEAQANRAPVGGEERTAEPPAFPFDQLD